MHQVETIQFAFIIGHDIAAIFECVISSAVFYWISLDAAGQRGGIFGSALDLVNYLKSDPWFLIGLK